MLLERWAAMYRLLILIEHPQIMPGGRHVSDDRFEISEAERSSEGGYRDRRGRDRSSRYGALAIGRLAIHRTTIEWTRLKFLDAYGDINDTQ
jgi:hypothetical protein